MFTSARIFGAVYAAIPLAGTNDEFILATSGDYLMKETLTEVGDFKIGGRIINKIRFADDTAIIAKTQEELQDMVNRLYGKQID